MATKFKKLGEVTLLDSVTNNTTVLVEENGEIKRAPKNEVGGTGGYVIKLENSFIGNSDCYEFEESYDNLYEVLLAGGAVWVDYENAPQMSMPSALSLWDATNWGPYKFIVCGWCLTDKGLVLWDYDGSTIYYPNGSHNLERIEQEEK